jgi:hypothetical protein
MRREKYVLYIDRIYSKEDTDLETLASMDFLELCY